MSTSSCPPSLGPNLSSRVHRARLIVAAGLLSTVFVGLGWRLFVIQVLDHRTYADSARRMQSSSEPVPAYRGDIHSRDGVLLARDLVDYEVGIDPSNISREHIILVVRLVCDALERSPEYRRERLFSALDKKEQGGRYVRLATEVQHSLVVELSNALERLLTKEELKGFRVQPCPRRSYPRDLLAGNVVGATNADGVGIEGIEKSLGDFLSRRDGYREVLRDASQKTRIYQVGGLDVSPVGGYDIYLTIDSTLQSIVEEELEAGIAREHAEGGVFLLFDPHEGDVLAMASYPTFNPNRFGDYPEPERQKRRSNKCIECLYEPGSVAKPFWAAYGLEMGIVRRDQLMQHLVAPPVDWDGGKRAKIGRRVVTDVHEHPGMTFEDGVVHSSNIALSILGLKLGKAGIMDVVDRFGFNRDTGISLPAEASTVPWAPPKVWNPMYSPVSASFGYEVMISPMQLCRAFAAVINGGYLLRPRIVDRVEREGEVRRMPSRVVEGQAISENTSREMREILRRVVEEGTAKWLKIDGFEFGGKTGTSNMAKRKGYTKEDYLASFEGFAPYENPRVVALCMIEKPRGGSIYGGMVAGPIVAEVFRRVFKVTQETKLAALHRLQKRA